MGERRARHVSQCVREQGGGAQSWIERPLLIALTGWTTAQDKRGALDAGFDHYLTKPADPVKLVRIIQSHLGARLT